MFYRLNTEPKKLFPTFVNILKRSNEEILSPGSFNSIGSLYKRR